MSRMTGSAALLEPKEVVEINGEKFRLQKLLAPATSLQIIEALGGLEKAAVGRRDFDTFLEIADRKHLYACFANGEAIHAFWYYTGSWSVFSEPVEVVSGWGHGFQVFSLNS